MSTTASPPTTPLTPARTAFAGWSAIVAGLVGLASGVLTQVVSQGDTGVFTDAGRFLDLGADPTAFWWTFVTDALGYYLLAIPAMVVLARWLRDRSHLADVSAAGALGAVLVGATGAMVLAAVGTPILDAGDPVGRQVLSATGDLVFVGMWQTIGAVLGALWLMPLGAVLRRSHRALGWVTTVIGVAFVAVVLLTLLRAGAVVAIPLQAYLILFPVWAVWVGILLLRGRLTDVG